MTEPEEDLRELITRLSRQLLEEYIRNVASHNEVRQLVTAGILDQRTVDKAYLDYMRTEGERYRRRAAEESIRYYGELVRLGTDWSKGFYDRLMRGLREPATASAAPQPYHVELSAPVGEWAGTSFEVSNDSAAPTRVTFVTAPFRGPADEVFRPIMKIEPESFVLAPAAVERVSLRVLLQAELFQTGRIYTSTVEVDGRPGLALVLSAWALARQAPDVRFTPAETGGPDQAAAESGPTEPGQAPVDQVVAAEGPGHDGSAEAAGPEPTASATTRRRSAARSPSRATPKRGSRAAGRSTDRT